MTRCGYIAILGAPNAGKSTLLNAVTGSKIAIVTPKVQTTRNRILGITLHGGSQMIFVDTPGVFQAKEKFEQAMVASAFSGARDADAILVLVDAGKGVCRNTQHILERLPEYGAKKKILVLNKVDAVRKESLLALTQELFVSGLFDECFMISALKGEGIGHMLDALAAYVPQGPYLFPEDEMTDVPLRMLAAEVTREKLFMQLRQELPYSVAVETEEWKEENKKGERSVTIRQVVYVRTQGQKTIVIGKGGEMLKKIGASARRELQGMLGCTVHLFLFVKVDENWKQNRAFYESIGLEY